MTAACIDAKPLLTQKPKRWNLFINMQEFITNAITIMAMEPIMTVRKVFGSTDNTLKKQ
ncbi:MAG TPA: hypothetical protein ACFYD5_02985 [Candidatus Tripitaka sp. YC43]